MTRVTHKSVKELKKSIPRSKTTYPSSSLADMVKYRFWSLYAPLHPLARDLMLSFGIFSHSGRQDFLIGKIAPDQSLQGIVSHLVQEGYGNHFIAWQDDEEIVSLRKVVNHRYQYHIRIFTDGEVRGHYEYAPEWHPVLHMKEVDLIDCREEFLALLQGKITPLEHTS